MLSVSITQHLRMSRRVGLFTCCQRWFSTEKLTNLSSNSAMSKTVNKVSSNRQPTSVSCSTVAGITPLHSSKLNEPTEGGTTVTPSSSRPHLISALDVRESGCVDVTWSDSREATSYPRVWLRDNCRCPACYNMSSQSRTLLMRDLVLDVHPTDLQVDSKKQVLHITWSDGHKSAYDAHWLRQRSFTSQARQERSLWYERPVTLWGADIANKLTVMDFEQLMRDDQLLYEWIVTLEQTGFVLLRNVPQQPRQIHALAERVGVLRITHYGPTSCVTMKPNPANVSYTGAALNCHTDLAYYTYVPGTQLMHCIKQAQGPGGANQFVDGFQVANQMRERYPDLFEVLCNTELRYYDIGTDYYKFHTISRHRTIELDHEGELSRIVYSNHSRDTYCHLPLNKVHKLYEALKKMDDLFRDPNNEFEYKMQDGEMATFNNFRVLHGRTSFDPATSGGRTLETGYVDWDEMRSRRRVLMEELGLVQPCL